MEIATPGTVQHGLGLNATIPHLPFSMLRVQGRGKVACERGKFPAHLVEADGQGDTKLPG